MAKVGRPKGVYQAGCGTATGYRRHYRLGEQPCQPCRKAHSEYLRARKAPTTTTRLLDALTVADGWMSVDLIADVLDVEPGTASRCAYRLRSRGVVEMRVLDNGHGSKMKEIRLARDTDAPSRAWAKDAACRESTLDFFPGERDWGPIREAKSVCEPCKVRSECLAYAIANNEDGIWGGTTALERRRMLEAA